MEEKTTSTSKRKVTAWVEHINIDKTFGFSLILSYFSILYFAEISLCIISFN